MIYDTPSRAENMNNIPTRYTRVSYNDFGWGSWQLFFGSCLQSNIPGLKTWSQDNLFLLPLLDTSLGLNPHYTAWHCQEFSHIPSYAVLCFYRVISGEGCVSLVMVNWPLLLLLPEALHTTGTRLIHTAMLGTCPAKYLLLGSWLSCA